MITDQIKTLLDKLKKKTEERKAIWQTSSGQNAYQIKLHSGKISVDVWFDPSEETMYAGVAVFNKNGDVIEKYSVAKQEDLASFKFLEDFHATVNRSYLKSEETLKGMFDEIDKDGEIGEDEDELPF